MLIKNIKDQAELLTDKEGDIYSNIKDRTTVKYLLNKIDDYFSYQVAKFQGKIGIQTEYEIAWLSESGIQGLNEKEMCKFEKKCLKSLPQLQKKYPNIDFFLSRTEDNINNSLIIHAFMDLNSYNPEVANIIFNFYTKNDWLYSD